MNDDSFDRKLQETLRAIEIPSDLHSQLLKIAEPGNRQSPTTTGTPTPVSVPTLPGAGLIWSLTVAASIIGLLVLFSWSFWAMLRFDLPTHLTTPSDHQPPTQPQSIMADSSNEDRQLLAELDRSLESLKEEYRLLELADQGEQSRLLMKLMERETDYVENEHLLQVIFCAAETSQFAGASVTRVQEQLQFLIDEFPQSHTAIEARQLLKQIQ